MNDIHTDIRRIWGSRDGVVPFLKGRIALYAVLKAAGVGPGDEVLMPGFTCVVVAAAVGYTGATPVFYDVMPRSYNGDPASAVRGLNERTRVVLIQHSFGAPAFLGELLAECGRRGVLVIEDCAHAIGARYADRPAGMLGVAAFTSLQWSKTVTTGLGGLARVNDGALLERLTKVVEDEFDEPSLSKSLSLMVLGSLYRRFYSPGLYWTARRGYRAAAGLGLVQGSSTDRELVDPALPEGYRELFGRRRMGQLSTALDSAAESVQHRSMVADRYREWCMSRNIIPQETPEGAVSVDLRFPLLVRNRGDLLAEARAQRIELGDWFDAPLHPREANAEAFGYRAGECPLAERLCAHIVNLPTHPGVRPGDVVRILRLLEKHDRDLIRDPDDLRDA